jgi:hypothetical protein
MKIRNLVAVSVMTLALGLPIAWASTESPIPPAVRDIVVQQSHLRAMVVAGRGPFKDLNTSDRNALVKTQTRVLELLDGRDSIDELRVDEKVELFNHLQLVKAAVTKAEDSRQICERTRIVGSNRFRLLCMNAGEYRDHKRNGKNSLTSVSP